MNSQLLVHGIVQQTMVLIAHVATVGGLRAPLARVANQVFLDLTSELSAQGLAKHVIADMFGMALRTYHRKVRAVAESQTDRGHSVWEAVLEYTRAHEPVTARQIRALLAEVDASAPGRVDCGLYNSIETASIENAMVCFDNAVAASRPAELTVNRCIDCTIETIYIATAEGAQFAILREQDAFGGDQLRHARVESCDAIALADAVATGERQEVTCVRPVERFDCEAPFLDAPVADPDPGPVEPLKIADVPAAPGAPVVPLHLYVSNQSFARQLVEIDVYMAGTRVVTGDFPVDDDVHDGYQFDIDVPVGMLGVRVRPSAGS